MSTATVSELAHIPLVHSAPRNVREVLYPSLTPYSLIPHRGHILIEPFFVQEFLWLPGEMPRVVGNDHYLQGVSH